MILIVVKKFKLRKARIQYPRGEESHKLAKSTF